jgi:DNA-binding SARP family transcriptional activator/class 3 adenylate cyclase
VEFRILGPLEVLDAQGRPLALGGPKQRALLAVLLLHAGQVVAVERLIDELWGQDPPDTAAHSLQVYVANLRKVLEPGRPRRAAGGVLQTRPPGYLVDLGPEELDLARFERLAGEGRAALAAGDPAQAARLLGDAVRLWRGPALADVSLAAGGRGEVVRLEERRLAALEDRIEAELALGRHRELVGELQALVAAQPLRERPWGQLMVALYRSGRQADALAAYRQTRETLAEELGIDPSRSLQDLERAILAQDDALDWAPTVKDAAVAPPEVPARPAPAANLPAPAEVPLGLEDRVHGETRRTVTVLCLGITATKNRTDLDPELRGRLADSYAGKLRAVVEGHGGTILELTEEGGTVVFGVPTLHENDALRAVRAVAEAREILDQAAAELASAWGVQLTLSAGIQTGEAVIEVAEGRRPQLAATPARLAGQLEQAAAPGEILLDTATCGLVRDAVRVELAPPLVLRGRGEPVGAWRLMGVRPGAPGRTWRLDAPMVGRSRQLAQLTGAFEAAVADQACQLFTVLGPAGVGKSRLVHEFLTIMDERATVLRGRCLDYGEGITYWPIAEVVRQAAQAAAADTPAEVAARLAVVLAGEERAESISARLAAAVGLAQQATAPTDELAWAVRKLLETLARRTPLVVVLDDLQWAEPTLLDLIEHVADWARDAPILLVCIARPELLEVRPGWAGGKLNTTSVLLEPLGEADCRQLIDALLGGSAGGETARARIVATTEGNPLFVEELVAMLQDHGLLVSTGAAWTVTADLAKLAMPPTISALLAARLDRLARPERAVIQRASVVGKIFPQRAVVELSPEPARPELPNHLMALVRKELIRPDRSGVDADDAFRFRHLLVRDAAYSGLPKQERAALHERFASWLERTAGPRLTEYEEILGHHLEQAYRYRAELGLLDDQSRDLATRAGQRLAAAGRRAQARSDLSAATGLLARAHDLLGMSALELEVAVDLAQALVDAGQFTQLEAVLSEVQRAAATAGDRRLEARGVLVQLTAQMSTATEGWAERARREAEQVVGLLEELGDDQGLAMAWTLLWDVASLTGRSGVDALERALVHAQRANDSRQIAHCVTKLATEVVYGPLPVSEATRRCEQLIQRAAGSLWIEADVRHWMAVLHAMEGRIGDARALVARTKEVSQDLGQALWGAAMTMEYAKVELLAGDAAAAERELRQGDSVLEQQGETAYRSTVVAMLAQAAYTQGHHDQADQWSRLSKRLAASDDLLSQVMWRGTQAKVLANKAETARAVMLAREAVTLAEASDWPNVRADALVDLAEVLRLANNPEEAVAALKRALALYRQKGNIVSAAWAKAELAELRAS